MKITLNDKEVRDAIEDYVARRKTGGLMAIEPDVSEVHIIRITRHHGGTVSALVSVETE